MAKPFRVRARDAIAHDLGTRFTVRAYPELAHVEVRVAEGSVSLRHDRTTEIAAVMGISVKGVEIQLAGGLAAIRQRFG